MGLPVFFRILLTLLVPVVIVAAVASCGVKGDPIPYIQVQQQRSARATPPPTPSATPAPATKGNGK